jgi:glycerol-3-phosphate dehydrogenase
MKRVAVIGAGVIGALVSRELTKYNLKVTILERMADVAMGATRANSAIVHAGYDAKEGSLKAKFNVQGSKMMEKVASELGVKNLLLYHTEDKNIARRKELYTAEAKNFFEGEICVPNDLETIEL